MFISNFREDGQISEQAATQDTGEVVSLLYFESIDFRSHVVPGFYNRLVYLYFLKKQYSLITLLTFTSKTNPVRNITPTG